MMVCRPNLHKLFLKEDCITANGDTVLHFAARGGSEDVVRLLLAFASFNKYLMTGNNQGQLPAHLSDNPNLMRGFDEANTFLAKEQGLETPAAFTPRPSRICAVCFMPPLTATTGFAYSCKCFAEYCEECFSHLCHSALNKGEFPSCCNLKCDLVIPMDTLRSRLPVSQLLTVAALLVNEKYNLENVYRQQCVVCNRVTDLYPVLCSDSPRHQCVHWYVDSVWAAGLVG